MKLFDKKIDEKVLLKDFLNFMDLWFFINEINITDLILFVTYIQADAGRQKTDKKIIRRDVDIVNEDEKSYKWDQSKKWATAKKFQTLRLEKSPIKISCYSTRGYTIE